MPTYILKKGGIIMKLLALLATTVLMDEIADSKRKEKERRIQEAKDRQDDRLRRKIRILKEEFGDDAIDRIKL